MIKRWIPWRWMIRRAARNYGIVDPFMLLARLRMFAEPSEVDAPLELIRAWAVFQARGIVNTRAIQHNLDWVWPYWVERQFNPRDASFVPRSFSLAHINLTHRNWTAVCVPDADTYALVDPRGLVTPLHDGWSLDAWITGDGPALVPSRCAVARQVMRSGNRLAIETTLGKDGNKLSGLVQMRRGAGGDLILDVTWEAESPSPAMLWIALRPYNPEGIQFIDSVQTNLESPGWIVNRTTRVLLDHGPARYAASDYATGDVFNRLRDPEAPTDITCPVGMATAAALFPLAAGRAERIRVTVPFDTREQGGHRRPTRQRPRTTWRELDLKNPVLQVPDELVTYLFTTSVRTLLSLSAGEVFPGSYTYRRFWFRDACIMLNALLALNHTECCQRALEDSFIRRQTVRGFFESQQGEWDSNGQVLWLAGRFAAVTGQPLPSRVLQSIRKGADWLCRKRLPHGPDQPHPGLLPPGFSAEHLGPNNHYYWDNFWGLAGLRAAAELVGRAGDASYAARLLQAAWQYERDIQTSIDSVRNARGGGAIPAAPGRRMDAGAIGSIVADYPLQLFGPGDGRVLKTVEFLLGNCMINNGFFHDMTHSGINPYLTLQLAQVLLRAGDNRYLPLMRRVAELASPTGQWPEAIHPGTGGGCMGDGQHGWAAAEWVLMVRALFIREEGETLTVCPGLPQEWLDSGATLSFGPTATRFGPVTVRVAADGRSPRVSVDGRWHTQAPEIRIALPARRDTGGGRR